MKRKRSENTVISGALDKLKKIGGNKHEILRKSAIAFSALIIILIGYYIIFPSRVFLHSDSVDTLMWAQASYDAGAIFNPDFHYACLLPFGGHLVMLPLVALFGVSMTTQVLGMLIFFIIFTASLFFIFRQLKWGTAWSCMAVSCILLVLSASEKLREIFWGHIIYYSLGVFFMLVGLGLVFKTWDVLEKHGISRRFNIFIFLVFVWFTLTATNQLQAMTLFAIPAVGALFAERFFSFDKSLTGGQKRGSLIIIAVSALASSAGYILGDIIRGNLTSGYADAYSTFSPPDKWFEHIGVFLSQWTSLLGVNIADGDPIMSGGGVMNLLRIVVSLILLAAPVAAALLYPKIKDRGSRVLILFHWFMSTLVMMGYIFGDLSAANWRLSPIAATSVVITALLCRWIYYKTDMKRLILIMVIPIMITGLSTAYSIVKMPTDYKRNTRFSSVVSTLKERDLTYGYATFWNANVITVLTDSDIKVRNIAIEQTSYSKGLYQSQNKWYDAQPGQKTYFVLASGYEYSMMDKTENPLIQKALDTIHVDDFYILIFDKNIF